MTPTIPPTRTGQADMAGSSWTNQVQNLIIVAGTGTSGVFVYDPTAGTGNLIASLTDAVKYPYGNVTEKGVSAYVIDVNSIREAVNLNVNNVNGLAGLSIRDTANPPADPPGIYGQGSNGTMKLAVALLDSGLVTGADVDAVVSAQSQTHSAITNGLVQALAGQVQLGNIPTLIVDDNAGAANLHQALIAAPAAPGNGYSHYANAVSYPAVITTSGVTGRLPVRQTDLAAHAAGNDASVHN